jgi:HK97 family phage major capsid protein
MPVLDRAAAGLIPDGYIDDILSEATYNSVALQQFRRVNIPTKVNKLPMLQALPVAKWVTGEVSTATPAAGEKTATVASWGSKTLTAEEIAAIVVVPEAVLEDVGQGMWTDLTEAVGAAIGYKLDQTILEGVEAPASFPVGGIAGEATTATNKVVAAAPAYADYNTALGLVSADGYVPNVIIAKAAQETAIRGWQVNGVPIYIDSLQDGSVTRLFGRPLIFTGALATTLAIIGDRSKAVIGVRRDLQYKVLDQAMIDIDGAGTMVNLAQQDAVALRVRARFGFAVANPVTVANPNAATRYPFAVINPA